jgi:hypothetical protein
VVGPRLVRVFSVTSSSSRIISVSDCECNIKVTVFTRNVTWKAKSRHGLQLSAVIKISVALPSCLRSGNSAVINGVLFTWIGSPSGTLWTEFPPTAYSVMTEIGYSVETLVIRDCAQKMAVRSSIYCMWRSKLSICLFCTGELRTAQW